MWYCNYMPILKNIDDFFVEPKACSALADQRCEIETESEIIDIDPVVLREMQDWNAVLGQVVGAEDLQMMKALNY